MTGFVLYADEIKWSELRTQKRWLVKQGGKYAEGLLNFLDYVQDSAVDQNAAIEAEVFGRRKAS